MRSAYAKTTSMLCSVNSTAMPRSTTRRLVSAISSLRSRGAMPAVGSSISRSFGFVGHRDRELDALDVAVGQRRCTADRPSAFMPTCSSNANASSRRCAAAGFHHDQIFPSDDSNAICTFSTTVSDAKVSAIWNVRPTPLLPDRRAASCRPARAPVHPHRRGWSPVSAASWPLTMLKVVDLPAPLGPIRASSSPRSMREAHAVDGAIAAERLAELR